MQLTLGQKIKARLSAVSGEDQEEYAAMIGYNGTLIQCSDGLSFSCDNGEWLTMQPKRKTEKDGKLTVSTKLGNTFTFRLLGNNVPRT